jgi:hypothetical protein
MERSCRYHLAQISVFLEHICNGNLSIAITDTNFLTKMQKGENQLNRSSLVITRKYNIAKFGYGGDMLKNL